MHPQFPPQKALRPETPGSLQPQAYATSISCPLGCQTAHPLCLPAAPVSVQAPRLLPGRLPPLLPVISLLSAFLQPRSQFRPHVSCLDVCPRFSLSSHSCPDRCCRHSNLSRGWGVVLFKKSFWLSQIEGNAKISGVGLKNLHQLNTAGPGNRTPAP